MRNSMKINIALVSIIFLIGAEVLFSQSAYRFQNYSINDGLSQSSVLCITQDDNYGLWVGTQDGLNRFDGKRFEVFTADEVNGLEASYVRSTLKLSNGTLWFGTVNGLTCYNPSTEKFKTYNNNNEIFSVEKITSDHSNNIWFTTSTKGVWKFDIKNKTFHSQEAIFKGKNVQELFISAENVIYVVSEDKNVEVYNPQSKSKKNISFHSKNGTPVVVQFIDQINTNELIFGTNQGAYKLNVKTGETSTMFPELDRQFGFMGISSMIHTQDDHWYIGTADNGLFTIHEDGSIFNSTQDIFQKNALLFNEISCLFQDKSGTIWVGTARGLSSFDPNNQGFLGIGPSGNLEQGIPSPTVWCFAEESNYVYVGTDFGLSRLNRNTGKFDQFERKKGVTITGEGSENAILGIEVVSKNRLLLACFDGVYELNIRNDNDYEYKPLKFVTEQLKNDHLRSYRIEKYKENQYFVATKSGVVLFDLSKKTAREFIHDSKQPKKSIKPGICRLIYKASDGRFFFATSSGGLSVLNDKSSDDLIIEPYRYNSALLSATASYITDIIERTPGDFWMGTLGSGVMNWNEKYKKINVYTKDDGLPNNVIYSVVVGANQKLWLSTNKGLCCFDPVRKKSTNYTEIHGLMSNEFNMGAAMKTKSGDLFFGGISGFNYFNPIELSNENLKVDIVFTKFKLDKSWLTPSSKNSPLKLPISQTQEINLSFKQRSFTIRFQPTNLSNPNLVSYKYILEGSDEGEIEIGNTNELRFNSLSSGTYTLKVYAKIGEGSWGDSPAELVITIESPFWAKWWFWTIVGLFLFIIIRFSIRKRIDYLKREQVRLEMKIADRTKEIREQNIKIEKQKEQIEKKSEKVEKQRRELQIEKEKSEKLLRNVIPESMAEELLEKGEASARAFKVVSVLFTDFVGFTKIADKTNPTELVKKLDIFFRKFDEIVFSNNLEKIKTIGDAYMCAGGVPVRNNTNPIDACIAGLQIQHYMECLKKEAIDADEEYWSLRLGINTGEVIAGVIGSKRLAYDVWGTTVNQAQRMEMLGEPGKVTITKNTFLHIEPYFECEFVGTVESKSKGKIEMYRVLGIKSELSIDGNGIHPNERFHQIVNLHHYSSINYYKAERFIMKNLEENLSSNLYYHSINHTKDVVKSVERLALSENVTDEGLFLLKTAANYHDAGFVEQYEKNEFIGARMAAEILPKYGYTPEHIERIKELIYVTEIPHQPKNKLEEIICDADLDYLGRDDFHEIADRLRMELKKHGKIDSDRAWDELQVKFLTMHRYFTKTAIETRRAKKLQNLEEIKRKLETFDYPD